MNKFIIDDVRQLYWVLLVLGCAAAAVYGFAMKRRALAAFASLNLLGALVPDVSRRRQVVKAVLILAAMCALVMALVGPRYGAFFEDVLRRKLDVIICLDVSRSMSAEDAGMSRLDRAKDDIKRLLDKLRGGAIGLVAFAGRADLACPLTDDFDFYRIMLDEVGMHSVTVGGTDIGKALETAIKALGDRGGRHRAIIVMSDGEDHGEEALAMAQKAREEEILVYTIGIGDQQRGALIPVVERGQKQYLMHDGKQVWSKMDPQALRKIAEAGGGEYHPSGQVKAGLRTLEWIYEDRLAPLQEADMQKKRVPSQRPQFAWFAALSLVLLMIETLVSEKRSAAAATPALPRREPTSGNGRGRTGAGLSPSHGAAAALLLLVVMGAPSVARAEDKSALRSAAAHNEEGNRLLAEGRYGEALTKYDEAKAALPQSPEVAYNRGLALYHLGRYADAENAFQDALKPGNLELEAKAKYNLGRCAHAVGMEKATPETLPDAVNELGRAIGFYNDALQLAPKDADASANMEAAERLRRYLEMRLEQEQQEKQEKDDENNENMEDSDKKEPTSQPDEQQPSSQPSENEQDQQGDESQQDQEGEQEQQSEGEEQQDQGDRKEQQQGKDSSQQDKPGDQKSSPRQAQSGEEQDQQLTEQQAEPMLQEARDAEQRRRAAKLRELMRSRGRVRVEKDW